jgi:hypothetical protein
MMPPAIGDSAKRPFSVSGIDCALAAPIPPRQENKAIQLTAAIEDAKFEGDVGVIMGVLRLKR